MTLVAVFVADNAERLEQLAEAARTTAAEEVRSLSHAIKGTAALRGGRIHEHGAVFRGVQDQPVGGASIWRLAWRYTGTSVARKSCDVE